ncbi:MAG: hypothetical protein VW540_06000 [Gammaproteobacteria bacterium]
MQTNEINTAPVQQFISLVRSADASRSKEIRMEINNAKRLAFVLGELMTKMSGDLEELLRKEYSKENEVIQVNVDGGNSW